MALQRMGDALGRPGLLSTVVKAVTSTLPRFDPTKYGVADYSFYEGFVDWPLAHANGLKLPILRVGQGYYGIDSQFKASSTNSKGLFGVRDFYWMLDTKQSANGQAQSCATALKTDGKVDTDSILWADFELAPANATFLFGFLDTLHTVLPNLKLGIYTGYNYWQTYGSPAPSWAQYPLWISWPVDPYREPLPLKPWSSYYYHQWTFNGDGHYYGTQSLGLDLDYKNPILVNEAVVLKRPKSQYKICLTPSHTAVLPLKDVVTQATENGWEVSMNCGAGFSYTDASHAQVKGISAADGQQYSNDSNFQSIYVAQDGTLSDVRPTTLYTAIPYASRAITNGALNLNLNNVELASWSLVGLDTDNIYLIVTKGREGVYGMTQLQAAKYAQLLGITNCYLMDSGHSSGIEANGQLLYSEYGESIPQCIGLKPIGGSMTLQAQELLGKTVTVRSSAQVISGNGTAEAILPHAIVDYMTIVDDLQHPGDANYKWLQLDNAATRFANYIYPPNGLRFTLLTPPNPQPIPTGTVVILKSWDVVVNVNGADYEFKYP